MIDSFMRLAIELAIASVPGGGGPFGAVVVRDGRVVGRGKNRVVPGCDPTAHAEVQAIRAACAELGTHELAGATLYTSCEPCPMCWGAIRWARIPHVRYGCTREDAARVGFDDAQLHADFRRDPRSWDLDILQLGRDEALAAFGAWEAKADRRPY